MAMARGLVLNVSFSDASPLAHVDDGSDSEPTEHRLVHRRLRQVARRRKRPMAKAAAAARLAARCTALQPFHNHSVAERCLEREHPQRFVVNECDGDGAVASDLAVAQANHLYLRDECAAACVFDPVRPLSAGWLYRASARCFDRWTVTSPSSLHPCVRAAVSEPAELSRLLGLVSRACPLRRRCRLRRRVGPRVRPGRVG